MWKINGKLTADEAEVMRAFNLKYAMDKKDFLKKCTTYDNKVDLV